jgi:hypothetical protein
MVAVLAFSMLPLAFDDDLDFAGGAAALLFRSNIAVT